VHHIISLPAICGSDFYTSIRLDLTYHYHRLLSLQSNVLI
jgi:hypothetical protein